MHMHTHAHTHTLIKGNKGRKGPWGRLLGTQIGRFGLKYLRKAMEQGRNNSSGRSQGRGCPVSTVGTFAQIFPWYIISATLTKGFGILYKQKPNTPWMKPQVPPTQFSCVQVPYSEATEAHDTESLAWGHPPPGVSMEIAHQVSRALNPDHE